MLGGVDIGVRWMGVESSAVYDLGGVDSGVMWMSVESSAVYDVKRKDKKHGNIPPYLYPSAYLAP